MKNQFSLTIMGCVFALLIFGTRVFAGTHKTSQQTPGPLLFTANKGQVSDQNYNSRHDVLFGGIAGAMAFHLRTTGISYQLTKTSKQKRSTFSKNKALKHFAFTSGTVLQRVDINWLGMNRNFFIETPAAEAGFNNYYLQSCPAGITNVPSYKEVTYRNVYKNTDLHYYEKDGGLKYDFVVQPGGDHRKIRFEIKGGDNIYIDSKGSLIIETPLGNIEDGAPVVFQAGKIISSRWLLNGNVLSFEIPVYDRSLPLVIDPTTRAWGTYYGSTTDDGAFFAATDASSNVFMCGATDAASGTLIATTGAYQNTFGGAFDAFLAKFNSAGVRQWGTYYGGAGEELASFCAVDAGGNIYITGNTDGASGAVMSSPGSHQPAFGGGGFDAYIAKFNTSGVRLWGSYYGDSGDEEGLACNVDPSGNVYMCGPTDSPGGTGITTPGSHQPTFGGSVDGYLVKFNSSGVRQWATYYGDSGDDFASNCICNSTGDVFINGDTDGSAGTVIATPGSHQPSIAGSTDAYLVKFNTAGVRQWGTYYGGASVDEGYGLSRDNSGNIFLAGDTQSSSGISTPGSHQPTFGGGNYDAFLCKFSPAGVRQWGTYYGGGGWDENYACAADNSGNIFLSGSTMTGGAGTAIATPGNHQSTYGGGGVEDAYLAKFNGAGQRQWGTYYGGNSDEIGYCAVDAGGDVYLTGYTGSSTGTVIASGGSHQSAFGGGSYDAFLAKFSSCTFPVTPTNTTPAPKLLVCTPLSTTLTVSGNGGMYWYTAATGGSPIATGYSFITPGLAAGIYTFYAEGYDCMASIQRAAITITVNPSPTVTAASDKGTICQGEGRVLTATGATTFTWSNGVTGPMTFISPTVTATYTAVGSAANGCTGSATITQVVSACASVLSVNKTSGAKLYPNPNKGVFVIETEYETDVSIRNALGEVIYSGRTEKGKNNLNLEKYTRGMYFVTLIDISGINTIKVIRE